MGFSYAMGFVEKWEGGFVNDACDPGGATKYGISLRFLRGLPLDLGDIDGDGDVDADDVLGLSPDGARELYRRHFWEPLRLEMLRGPVAVAVFDTAVNMGPRPATMVLQRTCADFGADVREDGVLGPLTLSAAQNVGAVCLQSRALRQEVSDRFCLRRLEVYRDICKREGGLRRYLGGWLARVLDLNGAIVNGPF